MTEVNKVNGEIIKRLIDRDASDEEKHLWLTDVMIKQPGDFWPAISVRTLGSKRIFKLELAADRMAQSANEDMQITGQYLRKVLWERRKRLGELEDYIVLALRESRHLKDSGNLKAAIEIGNKVEEAMKEQIDLIKERE